MSKQRSGNFTHTSPREKTENPEIKTKYKQQQDIVSVEIISDWTPDDDGEYKGLATTTYPRQIVRWRDIATLPHTRHRCVKWWQWGSFKTCIGWATETQWLYNTLWLTVRVSGPMSYDQVRSAIEGAFHDALVAGVVAGIVAAVTTGGGALAAAEQVFMPVFLASLKRRVESEEDILDCRFSITNAWGPWE